MFLDFLKRVLPLLKTFVQCRQEVVSMFYVQTLFTKKEKSTSFTILTSSLMFDRMKGLTPQYKTMSSLTNFSLRGDNV